MESRKSELQRFEFLLKINGHIICQRYFNISGYNSKSMNSLELNTMSKECVKIIQNNLTKNTREQLWKYYNPYIEQVDSDISRRGIYEKIDNFEFEFKIDGKSVIRREFSGNPYPPKVRYAVDIKEIIYDIINSIRYHLTSDEYTYYN